MGPPWAAAHEELPGLLHRRAWDARGCIHGVAASLGLLGFVMPAQYACGSTSGAPWCLGMRVLALSGDSTWAQNWLGSQHQVAEGTASSLRGHLPAGGRSTCGLVWGREIPLC